MRSQVQVLAGPPPIVAGQSAAGSELGALAAGLGRAGAARPSPPAPPLAPPGRPPGRQARRRPHSVVKHPARGRQPRGGCRHLALQPALVPTAQPPATGAPDAGLACLVARRASAAAAARTQPGGPGRHRPPTDQRDFGSVARVPASATVVEPSTARQPQGPPPVPMVRVARPPRPGPHRHRLSERRRTRPDRRGRHQTAGHRTEGHRTAGHRTAGQQPSDRRTLWTTTSGDRTPDGWAAGSRTPRPDGWTPPAGHRRPTPWPACWQGRPRRRRLSSRYRLDAPLGRRRLGQQPPGPLSSKDAGGTHAATDGSGHRRDR
jgi:hypothetical protein